MKSASKILGIAGAAALVVTGWTASLDAAQVRPERDSLTQVPAADAGRLSVGVGLSSVQDAFAAHAALAFPRGGGERVLAVRATYAEELAIFTSPSETAWDLGVLYGAQLAGDNAYLSAAAGLALVGGRRRGERIGPDQVDCSIPPFCLLAALASEYEEDRFLTAGIPIEVEAGWSFSSRLGVGATLFANINPALSSVGGSVNVVLRSPR